MFLDILSENIDILYVLMIALFVLGFVASASVNRAFKKYSSVMAACGMRASDAASNMLWRANSGVRVTRVSGRLTDHYNPKTETVGLSDAVYDSPSVAALAVAAHEIGHVMQYENGYALIKLRNLILPVAQIGSYAAPYIVIIGFFAGIYEVAAVGAVLYGVVVLFQLATLPVEFNASRRAIALLTENGYLAEDEIYPAKKVLRAAAMTYVVSTLAALVSFLRILAILNRGRRR